MDSCEEEALQPITNTTFELGFRSSDGNTELWHLGGVEWHRAPVPGRLHRCSVQTRGYMNYFNTDV